MKLVLVALFVAGGMLASAESDSQCYQHSTPIVCGVHFNDDPSIYTISVMTSAVESSRAIDGYSVEIIYTADGKRYSRTQTVSVYSAFRSTGVGVFFLRPRSLVLKVFASPIKNADVELGTQ